MALMSVSRPSDQSFAAMATPAPVNLSSKKKMKSAYEWEDVNAPNRGMNGKVKNKGKRVRVSDTSGNVTAGGPGSGKHTTFNVNKPDEVDNAHSALKKEGFKYQSDGTYKHSDGRTANIFMKRKVSAGGVGSGRKKEVEEYLKSKGFEQHKVFNRNTGKNGDDPNGGSHWSKTVTTNIHGTKDNQGSVVHGVHVAPDGTWTHHVTGTTHGHPSDVVHMPMVASSDGIAGTTLQSLQRILARAFKESKRKSLAKKGDALPDGSFPIANKKDLGNAKQAIGRSKHPGAARRLINKRAKQLGAPKIGAGAICSKNEDAIEYYSKGKKVKALGEDNLSNKKIMKFMEDQSAFASGDLVKTKHGNGRVQGHIDNKVYLVKTRSGNKHIHASELHHTRHKSMTLTCATGKISIRAGGPGSGRHITVTTGSKAERSEMHKGLGNKGFKMDDVKFGKDGARTHEYSHKNGDRVTMHYKPDVKAGGTGSGRKVGVALGKMLRQALEKRLSKAIHIAKDA